MDDEAEYCKTSKSLKKEKRIKKEMSRLKKLCADLSDNKKSALEGLIQELSFMKATLEECREEVNSKGVIILFEQGAQKMMVENPASKVYNTMINRYTTAYKQVIDVIPDGATAKEEQDKLMAFVGRSTR